MDLYKWASKCMPWVGSDLLWQCFQLALKARELDMRASPYDLSEYGYEPVKIETPEGRAEYETLQRQISQSPTPAPTAHRYPRPSDPIMRLKCQSGQKPIIHQAPLKYVCQQAVLRIHSRNNF